jgi:phage baseplate assembly protein W
MAIGVSLPIELDSTDGFTLNYSVKETIRQNFIMLLMTNPGERVMVPDFGVGIRTFLFTNKTEDYRPAIIAKVNQQVKKYLPVVVVGKIDFKELAQDRNSLSMRITYMIPDLGIQDLLELTI